MEGSQASNDASRTRVVNWLSQESIATNTRKRDTFRTIVSVASGCCAGALGIASYWGIVFFVLVMVISSLALLVKANFDVEKYFGTSSALFLDGIFGHLPTYVLFWTMFYNFTQIY